MQVRRVYGKILAMGCPQVLKQEHWRPTHLSESVVSIAVKVFNTTATCVPEENYMVDISERLKEIKKMVDEGKYFTINRARQYGKTTTLVALRGYLATDYMVISLDFQRIGNAGFSTEETFVQEFCRLLRRATRSFSDMPEHVAQQLTGYIEQQARLSELFDTLAEWCNESVQPLVLMIDEVDTATNNQVFLDFLAQLRAAYIDRRSNPDAKTFQSVILAGVTDVKHLKAKIRPEDESKFNSPWNIAADFDIDMSLSAVGIKGMLDEYEADHGTGMDTGVIATEIHNYTNGYPFLVSRICLLIDKQLVGENKRFHTLSEAWTIEGVSEAVRLILQEKNTLFDSLMGKVYDNEPLRDTLQRILFGGERIPYNPDNIPSMDGEMYGFIRNDDGALAITNRIFETRLYNYFLSVTELKESRISQAGANERAQFVEGGRLNMERLLRHYVSIFDDIYEGHADRFDEAEGRRRFLLFLRPVINGTGNYYVETQTRNNKRMDLVIDYLGERHVLELKIWGGRAYHEEGERQLIEYLDSYHLSQGYLLTYNFNKNKKPGIERVTIGGKVLLEAMV